MSRWPQYGGCKNKCNLPQLIDSSSRAVCTVCCFWPVISHSLSWTGRYPSSSYYCYYHFCYYLLYHSSSSESSYSSCCCYYCYGYYCYRLLRLLRLLHLLVLPHLAQDALFLCEGARLPRSAPMLRPLPGSARYPSQRRTWSSMPVSRVSTAEVPSQH